MTSGNKSIQKKRPSHPPRNGSARKVVAKQILNGWTVISNWFYRGNVHGPDCQTSFKPRHCSACGVTVWEFSCKHKVTVTFHKVLWEDGFWELDCPKKKIKSIRCPGCGIWLPADKYTRHKENHHTRLSAKSSAYILMQCKSCGDDVLRVRMQKHTTSECRHKFKKEE